MIRALRRTWNRLLASLGHREPDAELAEELETHVELMAEDWMRLGLPRQEAYRRARLSFIGIEATKESYRDQRGLPLVDVTVQDLRYAIRAIRKNRGFATVAVLSLAIGIGANTAIFSLLNAVLLQPLGFKDPHRVYAARELYPRLAGDRPIAVNPVHAFAWARECPSIDQVAVMRSDRADLSTGGEPVSVPGIDVPHNLFAMFGIDPVLGRTFVPEEEQEGRHRVAILSESLWRSRFHADPTLVGQSIVLDRQHYQVVGIVPGWFRVPFGVVSASSLPFEIYRPLVLSPQERARLTGNHNYAAVVRLRPGATAERAVAEMNVVQARFPRLVGSDADLKASLLPVHELVTGRARLGLWMLSAAVGAVLLIVAINLANLLLSRIASRTREAAIRTALGASRGRQFRMVLTESLLLAICGGALGVLFAVWLVKLLAAATALGIPRLEEVRIDGSVLAFSCGLTLFTGLVFGALPAWRLTHGHPQEALRAGSHTLTDARRSLRMREALISVEVGLSAALLILAGLLTSSLTRLLQVDKGFDPGHVLTLDLSLSGDVYADDAVRDKFFDRLLVNLAAIPGVQAAGLITEIPIRGNTWNDPIYLEGGRRHTVDNRYASPGYFRAMNIALRQGRTFDERDRGQAVAVLSEKAARLLWPDDPNPVGKRFMGEDDKLKTLVGIVGEVRAVLQNAPPPMAYYPYWQRVPGGGALVVRTTADPRTVAGAIRATIRAGDPQIPVRAIRTMDEVLDGAVAQRRFQLMLMTAFAAAALLVASLGIYGVVSYSVARRRNEIGIRMALGARRSELLRLVIRQGMVPVVLGLAAGVALALFLARAIRGLLFGVEPADPLTIATVVPLLLAVALLACLIPARRAAGTDPVSALRVE